MSTYVIIGSNLVKLGSSLVKQRHPAEIAVPWKTINIGEKLPHFRVV